MTAPDLGLSFGEDWRTVSRGGEAARLTAAQHDIVYALANAPHHELPLAKLMDRVHGVQAERSEATLEVQICHTNKRLRRLGLRLRQQQRFVRLVTAQ